MIRALISKVRLPSFSFSFATMPNEVASWQLVFLGIILFIACFYGIGSYAILDMNEGLYAEVAREMVMNNHWIIPHLNGVSYLEKPPLLYWLIAIGYKIFGINAFGARIIPSAATAMTALSLFYLGKKTENLRTGWIAALILLSSIVFLMIGRTVFFDPLFIFLLSASLLAFYFENINLGYIFLALAVLTKGVVAIILAGIILGIYLWMIGAPHERFRELLDRRAITLFLIIVLPWHILAALVEPRFIWEYIINQQFLRFFNLANPHDYHTGPIYYYIPRVLACLLPWSIFLLFTVWPLKLKRPFEHLTAFLWVWFAVIFVFFSLSANKGDYYLALGAPPLAYIIARKIEAWINQNNARWVGVIYGLFTVAFSGAGVYAIVSPDLVPSIYQGSVLLLVFILIAFAVGGIYFCWKNKNNVLLPVLLLALLVIPLISCYLSIRENSQFLYSQRTLAQYVKNQYQAKPVYLYQDFEGFSSFVFYVGFPCPVVDSHSSDLYYGSTTSKGKSQFLTTADFFNKSKTQFLYLVMHREQLPEFQKLADAKPFCAVAQNKRVVLLSNSPEDCQAVLQTGEQKKLPNAFP